MGNWAIRRARQGDAGALAVCIDAAYAQYSGRIRDLPPVSANCAAQIADHQVWVAETGGHIIGGLVLASEAECMRLINVAVHPSHTGGGLGRTLIALAESEASHQEYNELQLTTHVDMPDNIQFYARLGWLETGRDGNKVMMKKAI